MPTASAKVNDASVTIDWIREVVGTLHDEAVLNLRKRAREYNPALADPWTVASDAPPAQLHRLEQTGDVNWSIRYRLNGDGDRTSEATVDVPAKLLDAYERLSDPRPTLTLSPAFGSSVRMRPLPWGPFEILVEGTESNAMTDALLDKLVDSVPRNAKAALTALTEIPQFCSSKFPTLGRSVA